MCFVWFTWFGGTALIINTIYAGGDEGPEARPHVIFWGVALGAVVAALLLVGGLIDAYFRNLERSDAR